MRANLTKRAILAIAAGAALTLTTAAGCGPAENPAPGVQQPADDDGNDGGQDDDGQDDQDDDGGQDDDQGDDDQGDDDDG